MQNLSDMFTYMYQTMQIGELDTLTQIQSIALQFHSIKTTPPPHHPPLGLAAGILGAISGLFGLVPVLAQVSAVAGAVSGTLSVVNTEINQNAPAAPDSQFADNAADLASTLGIYTGGLRTHLENAYTGIFTNGTNITSLLSHGNFVNRTVLNLDCNDCLPASQNWMEQYLALKMINYMWWTQNVFITFMPCRFFPSDAQSSRIVIKFALLTSIKMARSSRLTLVATPHSTSHSVHPTSSQTSQTLPSAILMIMDGVTISALAWLDSPG